MSEERQSDGHRHVHTLFSVGTTWGMSDGQLLDRYAGRGGEGAETAFAALVERHGAMVLRVCRAILRDEHAAQDAFQATFLVLVRRATTLRARETLAPWLQQVAYRVSCCARSAAFRRRRHERKAAESAPLAESGRDWDDLPAVVHEEIGRLPEKFREAVVLCGLEGLTQEQAARQLGWPIGTLQSRLARGRERLRGRLARRGLAPSIGVLGAAIAGGRAASAMPVSLKDATISAAIAVAAGGTATSGTVPAAVARLTEGELRAMSLTQVKWTAAVLLTLGLGAAGVLARQSPEARDGNAPPPHERAKVSMPDYVVEPPDMILVEVLEALPGRPISGERLVRPDGKISLSFYGEVYVAGLTLPQVKEKILQHLRKYLSDEKLGLIAPDPAHPGQTRTVTPADSDRVFVDVTAYNSKNYYVQGEVSAPGKVPITGNDTVLDAINYAGGLQGSASKSNIRLVRPPGPGSDRAKVLKVDYEAIAYEGDPSTNYQLLPGDRLIVLRDPKALNLQQEQDDGLARLRALEQRLEAVERKLDRDPKAQAAPEKVETALGGPTARTAPVREKETAPSSLQALEQRFDKVERKLDRVIELLGGVPK